MTKRYTWRLPVSADEAARRAGGRRRYNSWRQFRAIARLRALVDLLRDDSTILLRPGGQADLARRLGVHRSTVSRDLAKLRSRVDQRCALCGHAVVHPRRDDERSNLDAPRVWWQR